MEVVDEGVVVGGCHEGCGTRWAVAEGWQGVVDEGCSRGSAMLPGKGLQQVGPFPPFTLLSLIFFFLCPSLCILLSRVLSHKGT